MEPIPTISSVSEARSQSSQRPLSMCMTPPLANRRPCSGAIRAPAMALNSFVALAGKLVQTGRNIGPRHLTTAFKRFMLLELRRGEGADMKKMLVVTVLATALTPMGALAQERA